MEKKYLFIRIVIILLTLFLSIITALYLMGSFVASGPSTTYYNLWIIIGSWVSLTVITFILWKKEHNKLI